MEASRIVAFVTMRLVLVCGSVGMPPFPSPDPSLTLDDWQRYTVAVREWQGDVALLVVFIVVTMAMVLCFFAAASFVANAVSAGR